MPDRPSVAEGEFRDFTTEIRTLADAGYLVVKIPECKKVGKPHGKHTLITRSALCDGQEPMPHAWINSHMGTFGTWCYCACGDSFPDYSPREDEPSRWEVHKGEHGLV